MAFLSDNELVKDYDFVANYFDGELIAYRAKDTGLLRIIDKDSGGCIMAQGGCVFTKSIEDAKRIADNKMSA